MKCGTKVKNGCQFYWKQKVKFPWNAADWIAAAGGKYGTWPQNRADAYYRINAHHGDWKPMTHYVSFFHKETKMIDGWNYIW
jgi:hypothetical protein